MGPCLAVQLVMAPTLPPPPPDSEAQALRASASEDRVLAPRLLASARAKELAAAGLQREARRLEHEDES